mmetsp:Transcript_29329/g.82623  ORF Transcript_29329/g.82623 Transcript_29329/m.82623 type:complete len:145 (+) Transcript_29329:134-568(+)
MEEPLDALKRAMHESVIEAEKRIDKKAAAAQETVRRLRLEREHLRAERDSLKAEVDRLHSDLSRERHKNERRTSVGLWSCCGHASLHDPIEVNVTENFSEDDRSNAFETRVPAAELGAGSVRGDRRRADGKSTHQPCRMARGGA